MLLLLGCGYPEFHELGCGYSNLTNLGCWYLEFGSEKAKKDAIRSATRVSELLVDSVNKEVQEAFVMQKRIEMEIRALAASILQFGKQTDQWLAASHSINTAIKVSTYCYLCLCFSRLNISDEYVAYRP